MGGIDKIFARCGEPPSPPLPPEKKPAMANRWNQAKDINSVKPGVYSTRKRDHRGCDAAMEFPEGCTAR